MAINSVFHCVVLLISLLFLQANAQNSTNASTTVSGIINTTTVPATTSAPKATTLSTGNQSTAAAPSSTTPSPAPTQAPTASPDATTKPPPATAEVKASTKLVDEIYKPEFQNKESSAFKKLNKTFVESMMAVSPPDSIIKITGVGPGSIIINFTISFKVVKGYDLVANLTATIKSGKLTIGNYTVDKNYIKFEQTFKGVTLTDYELDKESYQDKCCKSMIGQYKLKRTCTAKTGYSCSGIKLEIEGDCGKATNAPECSKACSLTNMSLVIILLGFIASQIFA